MTVEWQGILRRFVLGWGYTMKHNIGENGIKERVMWWLNIPIGCLRPDKNGRWTFETSCYKGHYLSAPTPLFIHPCLRARVIFIWMIYCIRNMAYNTDYKVNVNISLIYCWKWNTWSLTLNEFLREPDKARHHQMLQSILFVVFLIKLSFLISGGLDSFQR